jgi:hypothetical protein
MNIFRIRTPSVCEVFREFTVLPEIRSFYGIFGSLMHRLKAHDIPRRMTPSRRRSDIGNNVKSAEMEPNPLRDEGQTALFRAKSLYCSMKMRKHYKISLKIIHLRSPRNFTDGGSIFLFPAIVSFEFPPYLSFSRSIFEFPPYLRDARRRPSPDDDRRPFTIHCIHHGEPS